MSGFKNITEVKRANKAIGHHWFSRESVEYHGSRVETPVMGEHYWVESAWKNAADHFDYSHHANHLSPDDYELSRVYRPVAVDPNGAVQYLRPNGYKTLAEAKAVIDDILAGRPSYSTFKEN
jgi:hypothetical protein